MARSIDTTIVKSTVRNITAKGFWIGSGGPRWGADRDIFIPFSQVIDCDADLDDLEIGEEIELEIPTWLLERG